MDLVDSFSCPNWNSLNNLSCHEVTSEKKSNWAYFQSIVVIKFTNYFSFFSQPFRFRSFMTIFQTPFTWHHFSIRASANRWFSDDLTVFVSSRIAVKSRRLAGTICRQDELQMARIWLQKCCFWSNDNLRECDSTVLHRDFKFWKIHVDIAYIYYFEINFFEEL